MFATKEIERIIKENPGLTVRQFANQVGIKVRSLYRHWLNGYTPKELLDEKRLEIVKEYRLQSYNQKITDIARDLRFCDRYYFYKWFKRKMGFRLDSIQL